FVQPLRLPVGSDGTADAGSLVPIETQPAQIVQDRVFGLDARTIDVCVLNPKDECPAAAPGEQPVEERGANIADMKVTCRAGCKADAHHTRDTIATACTAMASPRPSSPTRSFVFPLTLTAETSTSSARARFVLIRSR